MIFDFEALLVTLSMGDHADLSLHLRNSSLAELYFFTLNFSVLGKAINLFEKLFLVVALLSNVSFHLLVVGIDLRVDLIVHILDFLN